MSGAKSFMGEFSAQLTSDSQGVPGGGGGGGAIHSTKRSLKVFLDPRRSKYPNIGASCPEYGHLNRDKRLLSRDVQGKVLENGLCKAGGKLDP